MTDVAHYHLVSKQNLLYGVIATVKVSLQTSPASVVSSLGVELEDEADEQI